MRFIQLNEELRIRFPGRDEEFDQGVEIGMVAALMECGLREFQRSIAAASVEQARLLASKLGYRVVEVETDGVVTELMFLTGAARPQLRLVQA